MSSTTKTCPQCGREYDASQKFCPEDGATLRAAAGNGDLVGQVIADRYHVLKKLGEGGMGQVYLAEHVRMKRKSAVKVMNPGMINDPDAVSRFNREAANASQINHPNVAAIYDFGETDDGLIYLAMEFVDGSPLSRLIDHHSALPAPRAAEITRQAAEALGVAHQVGIVHRDLKPDNIMVARNLDGSDLVKVVDFGIAKAKGGGDGQKVTRTGFIIGTPEYMSPEQLAGDVVDGRSDIYSLALVAFNMFTGKLPFPSKTTQEAMIMRLTERPRTLAEMKDDVPWPAELQAVMDKALERDADVRYQDARQFGRDLVKALEGMPQLTAEQLGTHLLTAQSLAARMPTPRGVDSAKGLPTMAAPAPVLPGVRGGGASATALAGPASGVSMTPPPAGMAPLEVPTGAAPNLYPSRGTSHRSAFVAGVGVAVALLAGAAFLLVRRDGPAAGAPAATAAAATPAPASGPAAPPSIADANTAATAATPAAAPSVTPATVSSAPAPAATAADAELRLPRTLPREAAVFVNGRQVLGTTAALPAGAVMLAIQFPGGVPRTATMRVRAGQRVEWPDAATIAAARPAPSAAPSSSATVASTQPAAPAPQPASQPAPQPAAPVVTAPAFDADAATREMRSALDRFATAFESRHIDDVRRAAPGISNEFAQRWDALLSEKSVSELTARVTRVGTPDFDGTTAADVPFTMRLEYKASGQRQAPEIQYSAHFRHDASGWRLQTVAGH